MTHNSFIQNEPLLAETVAALEAGADRLQNAPGDDTPWTLIVAKLGSPDFADYPPPLETAEQVLATYSQGGAHLVAVSDQVGALLGPLSTGPAAVFDTTGRLLTAYPHIQKASIEQARLLLGDSETSRGGREVSDE